MKQNRITPYLDDYDPYGDHAAAADGPDDPPISASGPLPLPDDLPHARCRDLAPRLGRWAQTDPVGYAAEGVNEFPYAPAVAPPHADDPAGVSGCT